jgi:hypothetical protein
LHSNIQNLHLSRQLALWKLFSLEFRGQLAFHKIAPPCSHEDVARPCPVRMLHDHGPVRMLHHHVPMRMLHDHGPVRMLRHHGHMRQLDCWRQICSRSSGYCFKPEVARDRQLIARERPLKISFRRPFIDSKAIWWRKWLGKRLALCERPNFFQHFHRVGAIEAAKFWGIFLCCWVRAQELDA